MSLPRRGAGRRVAAALGLLGWAWAAACETPPAAPEVSAAASAPVAATPAASAPAPAQPASAPAPAESEAEADAAPAAPPCAPRGEVPATWGAPQLAAEGRVTLEGGWEVVVDPAKLRADVPWPDEATEIEAPGWTRLPLTRRKHVVWARRRFTLPDEAPLEELALDLGGRQGVTTAWINGRRQQPDKLKHHPLFIKRPQGLRHGENELRLELELSAFSGGIVWYGAPALGRIAPEPARRGRVERAFRSQVDGSAQRVTAYIPRCADLTQPLPLLVALPGWGGNDDSYAGSSLMRYAEERGALVLVPDPRGNTLYIDRAEEGVLEAIALAQAELPVDPDRIALLGLSMGGAGALQIGYRYPDRFAALVAWYGDSRYDMDTYVKSILKTNQKAQEYSVIHFAENARNTPVLLIHAQDDPVSPVEQSRWLFEASQRLGFTHHKLIEPPRGGHSFAVLEDHMAEAVDLMLRARRERQPPRVSLRANAWRATRAWWLELVLARPGEFGRADVSFDPANARLTVHTLDLGLEAIRLHADQLGLEGLASIQLLIEEPLAGDLVLASLGGARHVRLWREGAEQGVLIPVLDGAARLPRLEPGAWRFDFPRSPP